MDRTVTTGRNGQHEPSLAVVEPRKLDVRTAAADLGMEVRVLRLEGTQFANDVRLLARHVQRIGIRDGSPDVVQVGFQLEHRAERHLRQRR